MPEPGTLDEMMNFVYTVLRGSAGTCLISPSLPPLCTTFGRTPSLASYKRKTSANAHKFVLQGMPAWENGGRFRHAQKRWHIVEKEAFVFGVKAFDYAHWINGGQHEAVFFTDHKNLLALFDDSARALTCMYQTQQGSVNLLGFVFVGHALHHISY